MYGSEVWIASLGLRPSTKYNVWSEIRYNNWFGMQLFSSGGVQIPCSGGVQIPCSNLLFKSLVQVVFKYLGETDPTREVILSTVLVAGAVGTVGFVASAVGRKLASLFSRSHQKASLDGLASNAGASPPAVRRTSVNSSQYAPP